jgi:hypothetical protein
MVYQSEKSTSLGGRKPAAMCNLVMPRVRQNRRGVWELQAIMRNGVASTKAAKAACATLHY